ncbi:hypothetical protein HDU79_000671 [Rhizoclosmatium sp. JEL0117]|nr:hypothetical protein HDU79_000671 [Rhizoclosmatium sp. JEL0117]
MGLTTASGTETSTTVSRTEASVESNTSDSVTENLRNLNWNEVTDDIESLRKDFNVVGCAVGVVHNGKLIYSAGFGNRNDAGDPVNPDTLFQIGSTTKAFTAFGIATLVDEKKVNWETPVTALAPVEFQDPFANAQANLVDLLSHRTGLPRHDYMMNIWSSVEEVNARIKYLQPSKQFRQAYQYNNNMYNLAGSIAGRLYGSTWDDLVKDRILTPLGMDRTITNLEQSEYMENHARGYELRNDGSKVLVGYKEHCCVEASEGDGSMASSVNDMAKWLSLILNKGKTLDGKELVSKEQFDMIMTPHSILSGPVSDSPFQLDTYGLGWYLCSYKGKMSVSHGGGMPGFLTAIELFPNDNLGIVVFCNSSSAFPFALSKYLSDLILFNLKDKEQLTKAKAQNVTLSETFAKERHERIEKRDKNAAPTLPLGSYQGSFVNEAYGTLLIDGPDDENRFNFWINGAGERKGAFHGTLKHWENDSFGIFEGSVALEYYKDDECPMELMVEFNKDATEVRIALGGDVDTIVFKRV